MADLSVIQITQKWPAQDPDCIQLYSVNSPNGVKASIMLEETGLPYELHLVRFDTEDQKSREFRSLNPYAKIPAIIDPNGPDGAPLPLFESGAILIYLAEKSGQFLPRGAARYETIQWLTFQTSNIGPMFGQVGFFHKFDGKGYEDKRPRDRYVAASARGARCASCGARVDHARGLHDRRHRHVPASAQPDRLLRCRRSRRHR